MVASAPAPPISKATAEVPAKRSRLHQRTPVVFTIGSGRRRSDAGSCRTRPAPGEAETEEARGEEAEAAGLGDGGGDKVDRYVAVAAVLAGRQLARDEIARDERAAAAATCPVGVVAVMT